MKRSLGALALLLAAAGGARAHGFDPALLEVRALDGERYEVRWKYNRAGGEGGAGTRLQLVMPAPCRAEGAGAQASDGDGPLEQARMIYSCPGGLANKAVRIDGLGRARVDALVRYAALDGREASAVLRGDAPEWTVPDAPRAANAFAVLWRDYSRLGILHILGGWDHLLFVAGLFFLVAGKRALVGTLTAFTLAHSLTLALVVLGVARLPPAPVEAAIALSLVALASELARPAPASLVSRSPWLAAFGFGLLHGGGFAGALAEAGLPEGHVPAALLWFNVGIEVGQLAFVLGLALVAAVIYRVVGGAWRRPFGYAMGAVSSYWCIERVAAFWP